MSSDSHDTSPSLWDSVPLGDLASVARRYPYLFPSLASHVQAQFDSLLNHYHLKADALRDVMRKTGAIIGGDAVIRFLLGLAPAKAPLEIYVPDGEYGDALISKAILNMGLEASEDALPNATNTGRNGVRRISGFKHPSKAAQPEQLVILISTFPNVLLPISQSWTTATMSYITADSVFTVYPELTFARRAIVRSPDWDLPQIAKSGGFRPLLAIPPTGREAIKALDELGFDTRRYFSWDNASCGRACGPIPQSFDSPRAFEIVFGIPSMPTDRPYRFAGRNVHFLLRGECRNPQCDNYGDVFVYFPLK